MNRCIKPLDADLRDAITHASEVFERDLDLHQFTVSQPRVVPMRELAQYDDLGSWAEWATGDLAELSTSERLAELRSFRDETFARNAAGWIAGNPYAPIVIVRTRDHDVIGDGRGRVSVALGMDWHGICAVFLTENDRNQSPGARARKLMR